MNFYYCIFSVACLEEEKKMQKMAKNGQKLPKKINLSNDGNRRTPPPMMEIKLIQKINLRKDGNRRTWYSEREIQKSGPLLEQPLVT